MASSQPASVVFRRPTREHALALARERFLAGDRIEMQTLASELEISRATLYRWVGEREQLLDEVFGGLIDEWVAHVAPEAEGTGIERFLDVLRRFLRFAAASEPLTDFTQREPVLALRLLGDRTGAVSEHTNEAVGRLLRELGDLPVPEEIANAIGLVARTLVWANIATGRDPDIDGAVEVARTLLNACATTR